MGTKFHDVTIMKCSWTLEFLDFISYVIELKIIIIFFVILNSWIALPTKNTKLNVQRIKMILKYVEGAYSVGPELGDGGVVELVDLLAQPQGALLLAVDVVGEEPGLRYGLPVLLHHRAAPSRVGRETRLQLIHIVVLQTQIHVVTIKSSLTVLTLKGFYF